MPRPFRISGVITQITLPSGREIDYTLNANAQVSGVSADVNATATTLASSITYLPFGPMDSMTYGNSLVLAANYDQDYWPTSRSVNTVFSHTYDTDDNGNITQKGAWTYDYDALNRLDEQDDGSTTTAFTYDAIGNRLTENDGSTTTYTYPSTSSKLSSVGSDSYTYDSAGNITGNDVLDFVWDAAGRLEEAKTAGTSTVVGAYVYDYANKRTSKTVSGTTTHYVYGQGGLLYGEYDNTGALIREYVYLNGEPLAQIDAGGSETLIYLHTDHLMTPRYATNTSGSTVWTWDSGAFGAEAPTGSATVNLRFPGQYYDDETSLHYNWNRYYDPATGRYISSDPIGLSGGLNTYLYAGASPIVSYDPEGLFTEEQWPKSKPPKTQVPKPNVLIPQVAKGIGTSIFRACTSTIGIVAGIVFTPTNPTCRDNPEVIGPKFCTGNDCDDFYNDIKAIIADLKTQYGRMLRDAVINDLYNRRRFTHQRTSRREGTWEGHQLKFQNTQNRLAKAVALADKYGCDDYDKNEVEQWLNISPPNLPIRERIKNIGRR